MNVVDEGTVCGDVLHPDGGAFFGGEIWRIFGEEWAGTMATSPQTPYLLSGKAGMVLTVLSSQEGSTLGPMASTVPDAS